MPDTQYVTCNGKPQSMGIGNKPWQIVKEVSASYKMCHAILRGAMSCVTTPGATHMNGANEAWGNVDSVPNLLYCAYLS